MLMPWEHVTPALCCAAAEEWLRDEGRSVKRVYEVEWWAAFYISPDDEARYQRWELVQICRSCEKGTECTNRVHVKEERLVLAGMPRAGWPLEAVA